MILDRLLVRHKLNLLVAFPLVTVAALTTMLLGAQVGQARRAATVADRVDGARQVGTLVQEIQRARLLGIGYLNAGLVSAEQLELQLAAVHDARAQLLRGLGPDIGLDLARAVQGSEVVIRLGTQVLGHEVSDEGLIGALSSQNQLLIAALQLDRAAADSIGGDGLRALDALLRADEASSQAGALLLAAAVNPALRPGMISDARVAQGIEREQAELFAGLASPVHEKLYRQATEGTGALHLAYDAAALGTGRPSANDRETARDVFSAVRSQSTVRQLVDVSVTQSLFRTARQASTAALIRAAMLIGLGLALLSGAILLLLVVGRSVSTPLRRLTDAAGTVADAADDELADVADDDAGPAAVRRLAALPVTSRDELGELAVAFNRVQSSTARLLERQVVSRRNVAAMFASVGRRTSNLVGRQLALIDNLESIEEDTHTLGVLYRLDHLSTRLRRNASSLVVLSGDRESAGDAAAVSLPDAVRAALGSVEEFQRVSLSALPEVHLSPGASADVVLILSEVIENGVLFSPPRTSVEVAAWVTDDSRYAITVVDHGIGMPPQRLAEENARLRQRERLDLAPTDVLGLFVVGRVSRRHGIDVTLISTPGGGVTARIVLPSSLFVDNPWSGSGLGLIERVPGRQDVAAAAASGASVAPVTPAVPVLSAVASVAAAPPIVPDVPVVADQVVADQVVADQVAAGQVAAGQVAADQVAAGQQVGAGQVAMPTDSAAVGPDLPSGVRRRVPGTHWEGPPPPARGATKRAAAPAGFPGAAGSTPPSGTSAGFIVGAEPESPDPEATRRQVEDLETVLSDLPQAFPATPSENDPSANNPPANAPPSVTPDTTARTGGLNSTEGQLVRRVPGATLAALGAAISEPASLATAGQPVQVDADEAVQTILDVDEAIQRARMQTPEESGSRSEGDAMSRGSGQEDWLNRQSSHENGGGR